MNSGAWLAGKPDGGDEAGKSGTGAEIDPDARIRHCRLNLQRIGKVPHPNVGQGRNGHEIDRLLPLAQKLGIDVESLCCFPRQREKLERRSAVVNLGCAHPARRIWAVSKVSAAGVMPSIRLACPMVCGRIAASFWRISAESPGRFR